MGTTSLLMVVYPEISLFASFIFIDVKEFYISKCLYIYMHIYKIYIILQLKYVHQENTLSVHSE